MRIRRSNAETVGLSAEALGAEHRRRPQILAAVIYLGTALILISYLLFTFHWNSDSWLDACYDVAGPLGVALLAVSTVFVLTGRRFAHPLALAGTILEATYVYAFYPYRALVSPWLTFNLPYDTRFYSALVFVRATLAILAIVGVVAAAACSLERLMPRTWRFGKTAVRDRTWPAFAITLLFSFGWYLRGVVPYRTPIIYDHIPPILSVLHVEKHGLQFHETKIGFYRDSAFYVAHDDHRLFQYSFRTAGGWGVLTKDYSQLLNQLAESPPTLPGPVVSHYSPPHAWNADSWFIVYYGRTSHRPLRTEGAAMPPKKVIDLFYGAQKLPREQEWQGTARDVCFGFCYSPEN
jgi:hypothetical protein